MIKSDFWKGKTVFLTGHTGFKGSWLSIWLNELGAKVIGYSLDPLHENDLFNVAELSDKVVDIRGDIRDKVSLFSAMEENEADIVIHMAAQPLVRLSYSEPLETYETNVMGTANVLEGFRKSKKAKVGIFITTDKCYQNNEQMWGYRETDPMGGFDPYSSSKGACELLISSWRNSFFPLAKIQDHGKAIASVRAGNVIGGGDWSLDRLVPDCIKAIQEGQAIEIRNPSATRPWEHVLEPLSGYMKLAEKLWEEPLRFSGGWNFGPDFESIISVEELTKMIVEYFGKGEVRINSDRKNPHEARLLALDITKAKTELGWFPTLSIKDTIKLTVEWYKQYQSTDSYQLSVGQIKAFLEN